MTLPNPLIGLALLRIGLHLIYGALQATLLFGLGGAAWRQHLTRAWSRQMLGLLGIRVESVAGLDCSDSGLLVGNHISFVDVFVINSLLPSTFVAKSEIARWPLIGWLCRRAGTVFIDRGSRTAAQRTRQQMLTALESGQRLAVFPEGTSTAGGTLLPFHAALFQSAIDAAAPVHAIALSYHDATGVGCTAPAYTGDIRLPDCLTAILQTRGLVARVTLAASFDPPLAERRHLAHRAHQAIAVVLERTPGLAPAPLAAHTPDPSNRGGNPLADAAQPLRNAAAITR